MSKPRQRSTRPTSSPEKNKGEVTSSPVTTSQTSVPRPALGDRDAWPAYWKTRGQPWRTEPEIDSKRQTELAQRRSIPPDIEKGVYPFRGMKLSRADVEWLLATHENGRGPVNWSDEQQRKREGLDLRGANLCYSNLSNLPLARLQGGLDWTQTIQPTVAEHIMAGVHMEKANLKGAYLEGALFCFAVLNDADFMGTHLETAKFTRAVLLRTVFGFASLKGADLSEADLEGANCLSANLERSKLVRTNLRDVNLFRAHLAGADLYEAFLDGVRLDSVQLSNDKDMNPRLANVRWGNVNLTVVDWSQVSMLHYERVARTTRTASFHKKSISQRRAEYQQAVQANRQLATILRSQGLNEEAARFAYHAQALQRTFLWLQMTKSESERFFEHLSSEPARKRRTLSRIHTLGAWLFSWFLFLIAGYGYKPSRSFLAYLLVISGFATAYYLIGHTVGPVLSPLGAFVFSMTSFHGRGFFPGNNISLDDPLTVLAALEALVGLIIEVTFIATLTQRFFNR